MNKPSLSKLERIADIRLRLDALMAQCLASPPDQRESYRPKIEPLAREYHELHDGKAWYTYRHTKEVTIR